MFLWTLPQLYRQDCCRQPVMNLNVILFLSFMLFLFSIGIYNLICVYRIGKRRKQELKNKENQRKVDLFCLGFLFDTI